MEIEVIFPPGGGYEDRVRDWLAQARPELDAELVGRRLLLVLREPPAKGKGKQSNEPGRTPPDPG